MANLITPKGKLNVKTDKKGNLVLYRQEKCDDFYKKKGRDCKTERIREGIAESESGYTEEINKYLPERRDTKAFYWGMTPRQNMEKLHQYAEHDCECLTIAKIPKHKVYVGNYEYTNDLLDPEISEEDKKEIAKYYDMISYTKLEKLKPEHRKVRYEKEHLEFLVK